jgi:hypothetical protein
MKHVFDNPGFKKHLLTEEARFKADGLSIWFNKIPIPLDLFDNFFDSWRDYFQKYIDHLMVSIILANNLRQLKSCEINFKELPGNVSSARIRHDLIKIITNSIKSDSKYQLVAAKVSSVLGRESYLLDSSALMLALSHTGKKYQRLFIPSFIRKIIEENFPLVLDSVGTGNGDMFGNIIADGSGLYRAGFGDACSALFNKLLEYKIDKCSGPINKNNSVTLRFENSTNRDIGDRVLHERTTDGSLWQPFFDGDQKIRLNPSHPFYKVIADSGDPQAMFQLLLKMSEVESYSSTRRELELFEDFRRNLSKELWNS